MMAETAEEAESTTDIKADTIFDFFRLPRELRDEIYSMLTDEVVTIEDGLTCGKWVQTMQVFLQHRKLTTALLLNRQFQEEYEQEIQDRNVVIFKDHGTRLYDKEPPFIVTGASNVVFRSLIKHNDRSDTRCDCLKEMKSQVRFITRVLSKFRSLRSAKIELYPCSDRDESGKWTVHAAESMKELEKIMEFTTLSKIEVYPWFQGKFMCSETYPRYGIQEQPVATWTRTDGWKNN